MNKFNLTPILLSIGLLLMTSCAQESPRIFERPNVKTFVTQNDGTEFLILLAYGGSAYNSISEPIIENENGNVQISFTNKQSRNIDSFFTSFRSFSSIDRGQVSAIIEISERVDRVSYYFDGQWKQVWPSVE